MKETAMHPPDYLLLDPALDPLRHTSALLRNGLVNHAPMAAEALVAMGQGEAAGPWVTAHMAATQPSHDGAPKSELGNWREALGDFSQDAAWRAFFTSEVMGGEWQPVLDLWSERLAPGLFAAATHGIIRVGHAVRALDHGDTFLRRRELAEGLALWASSYQALPTDFQSGGLAEAPGRALDLVPLIPEAQRRNEGAITTAMEPLEDVASFAPVIGYIDLEADPATLANEIATVFAQVFLDQVHTPLTAIVYTHSITAVAAILNIAPHVSDKALRALLAYGWQAVCGLYAAYALKRAPGPGILDKESVPDIVKRAVTHGDDHVIKLSEVCIRFYEATGDERFLMVPLHARALLASDAKISAIVGDK